MNTIFSNGTVVLFQGDSITDCGRDRQEARHLGFGYAAVIARLYDELFPGHGVTFLNRGVSGDRSAEMLRRYDTDVVALKPDLVSILIGINDTWRRYDSNDPTSAESFERNFRAMLQNIKRDLPAARIVIIEPFLLNTMADKQAWREDLDPKIEAVRRLAREFADVFIPMDGIFVAHMVAGLKDADITEDGVHPTPVGHAIIAQTWLQAVAKKT
ncbi:MAG: SGNH/GDSL hydrolase family protein [Treponema sp.]|jgi:lysophospholipase L1-like esterase|nr:SGNH/GDSL hydrolase family protein [Treponema sp.]